MQTRDRLEDRIAQLRAELAPIRLLQPELLQEIFMWCLPRNRNPTLSAKEAPILLTRICSYWRQLAFSTPSLWTALDIATCYNDGGTDVYGTRLAAITEWLSRC